MDNSWIDQLDTDSSHWQFGFELRTSRGDIQSVLSQGVLDTSHKGQLDDPELEYEIHILSEDLDWSIVDSSIRYRVPVDIKLWKKFLWTDAHASGVLLIDLETRLDLDQDWQVQSKSEWLHHEWKSKPRLKILGIGLKAERILDFILKRTRDDLVRSLDRTLRQKLEASKVVGEIQELMISSINLEYDDGVRNPDIQLMKWSGVRQEIDEFAFQFSATGQFVDRPSTEADISPKLPSTQVTPWQQKDRAYLQLALTDRDLLQYLQFHVGSEEITISKSRKVVLGIADLKIVDGAFHFDLDVSRNMEGRLLLEGKPHLDRDAQSLDIQNLKIKPKLGNIFHNTAVKLMRRKIEERMTRIVDESLQEIQDTYRKELRKFLDDSKEKYPVFCDFEDLDLRFDQLRGQHNFLYIDLKTRGPVYLRVR